MPEARRYGLDPGANGNAMPTVRSTYSTMAAMKARSAARRTPLLLQFAPIEMAPSTLDFARPTFQEIHRMARTNRQTSARQARKPRKREGAPSMFIRVENNHYFGLAEDIEAPSGLVVVHANAAALRLLATALHRIAREVERDSEIKRSTEPRSYPPFGFRLRPGDPPVRCAMSDIIAIEFRPYSNSDPPRSTWDEDVLNSVGVVAEVNGESESSRLHRRAAREAALKCGIDAYVLAEPGKPVPFISPMEPKELPQVSGEDWVQINRRSEEFNEPWTLLENRVVPVPNAIAIIKSSMKKFASRGYIAFGLDVFAIEQGTLRPIRMYTMESCRRLDSWEEALRILAQPEYATCHVQIMSESRRRLSRG
jgi:hypothetical protein